MKGLRYQLKSIRRDKMCILSFLLPIVAGLAIRLFSGVDFQTVGETAFGIVEGDLSGEAAAWLRESGNVTRYGTERELREAVEDPSTQMIGVLSAGEGIRTLLAGDELEVNRRIAEALPGSYDWRGEEAEVVTVVPGEAENEGLISLLIVLTLVTAMFMGCTFNAMNIIGEKEDGIVFINQILPMTAKAYMLQKTLLGFIGGTLSAVLTALLCMRIAVAQMLPLAALILLSAFLSALMGLYIGHFSEGLMIGIVYIKILMIGFLAPPIFFYLMVPEGSVAFGLSYLLPSGAAFYGLMDLAGGGTVESRDIAALGIHCLVWFTLYIFLSGRRQKRAPGALKPDGAAGA